MKRKLQIKNKQYKYKCRSDKIDVIQDTDKCRGIRRRFILQFFNSKLCVIKIAPFFRLIPFLCDKK